MEANDVYRLLIQYNDDELFYKDLFLSRQNPVKYAKLMESLSIDSANQRQLIIPEFQVGGYRPTRFKDDFLDSKIHKNVYLQKHNRYTPPYEHDHEFFEIVYVLSGKCENNIFGSTDTLEQGDLCLMSPSVKHSIWTEDGLIINILIRRSTIQNVFQIFSEEAASFRIFSQTVYILVILQPALFFEPMKINISVNRFLECLENKLMPIFIQKV